MEEKYRNRDERFGMSGVIFTMPEMIKQYRMCDWDVLNEGTEDERKMTDEEIVDDVMTHDIEPVEE